MDMLRLPLKNTNLLNALDNEELKEGYFDGLNNEPEPNDNRSYSYWHGWRNGMVDGGHRVVDKFQKKLARDFIAQHKEQP